MDRKGGSAGPRLLPVMRYRNLVGAVDWLRKAFGFEEYQIVKGDDGGVLYAIVTFDNALIMLGPVHSDGLMKQPDEIGGAETQSCYIVVRDPETHYARAKAAGATIIFDLKAYDHGGRGYSCRDSEGHIWSFGTYDPWKLRAVSGNARKRRPLIWAGSAALLVLIGVGGWLAAADQLGSLFDAKIRKLEALMAQQTAATAAELEQERSARLSAERSAQQVLAQLTQARAETDTSEQKARGWARRVAQARLSRQRSTAANERASTELAKERSEERVARQRAERLAKEATAQRAREHSAREVAERTVEKIREELNKERQAKEAVQLSTEKLQKELAGERNAKEAVQRSAEQLQKELVAERNAKETALNAAKTLREGLVVERRAKEEAERAAEAARSLLAELQETKESTTIAPEAPAPAARSKQTKAPKPKPAKETAREAEQPMPALVP